MRLLGAALLAVTATVESLHVYCPSNCTAALQAGLLSGAAHVLIHPPKGGGAATIGSPERSTRIVANGTNMIVEFMPGLELAGFLNNTFYPRTGKDAQHGYSPALVTLEIHGSNLTMRGKNTVLRRITSYAGKPGNNVRLEGLQFINPGWDGMYVRGIVGLTLKDCVFDRPYRNGISIIDTVDMLAENCTFSNSLPNGTGRVSPMAGVDLEPNRVTDRLHNITFRKCKALNNSGAGFQAFPVRSCLIRLALACSGKDPPTGTLPLRMHVSAGQGNLNASSLPVTIRFEDCHVEGVGFKPYGTVVSCGYYFNSFGGKGARGSITVSGGSVKGTVSFGAAIYAHGANDPRVTFSGVTFDHVAINPGVFEPKLNFSNGPLAIAALGNKLEGNDLGGVMFKNVVVKDDRDRPALVVVGSEGDGVASVSGSITVHNPHHSGCSIVAGAEGWSKGQTAAATKALTANVSVDCLSRQDL